MLVNTTAQVGSALSAVNAKSDAVRDVSRAPRTLRFYGDEFVFDTVSGMFYALSPTASFILRALDAGTPRDQLADKVQRRYGITHAAAVQDIERLHDEIAGIQSLNLVRA